MTSRRFTDEMRSFIMEHSNGVGSQELTVMLNERFSTSFSLEQVTSIRYRLGAKSGLDCRFKKGLPNAGEQFRFKKGHVPAIKGRTWDDFGLPEETRSRMRATCFKKGNMPHNMVPVGTETMRADGYIWRKIAEPDKWRPLHILIWEEANGPVPEGMCVTFLDGDRSNADVGNLMLISRRENRIFNRPCAKERTDDAQLTKANIALRRIEEKIRKIEEENG